MSSLTKSYVSENDADKSDDSSDDRKRTKKTSKTNGSIADHYSNDPNHRGWRDSMDKKTRKELMAAMDQQRPDSYVSVDTLGEKRSG